MIGYVTSQQGIARKKLLVILAVVAVVAVTAVAFLNRSQPDQGAANNPIGYRVTADQFMKFLARNDPDAAFNLMTGAGKQDVGGLEKWEATVNNSFSKAKATPVFVSQHDIQDSSGIYADRQPKLVTYRLEIFNARWEVSLTVIKDQGVWRVDRVGTELR